MAILAGGSDLFSGARGISKGTVLIKQSIAPWYDSVLAVNYNYFLDFGRALRSVQRYIDRAGNLAALSMYGYGKGGDVVLQLARSLQNLMPVELLVTIDIAYGHW